MRSRKRPAFPMMPPISRGCGNTTYYVCPVNFPIFYDHFPAPSQN